MNRPPSFSSTKASSAYIRADVNESRPGRSVVPNSVVAAKFSKDLNLFSARYEFEEEGYYD